jgi:hypothetical protein
MPICRGRAMVCFGAREQVRQAHIVEPSHDFENGLNARRKCRAAMRLPSAAGQSMSIGRLHHDSPCNLTSALVTNVLSMRDAMKLATSSGTSTFRIDALLFTISHGSWLGFSMHTSPQLNRLTRRSSVQESRSRSI